MNIPTRTSSTDTSSTFDTILGGYKTYITAAIGIVFNVLTAFNVWNPTPEQTTAINGAIVLLAAAFLRAGVKKAQIAADPTVEPSKPPSSNKSYSSPSGI